MGVRVNFSYNELERAMRKDLIAIERNIIRIMKYCGEQFVSDARNALHISPSEFPKGDYTDRTANLRNSIGYFVLRDSDVVETASNSDAQSVLSSIPPKRGYRLIGVAGMNYASALEARGYNVITSQEGECFVNLGKMLKKYSDQLGKKGMNIDFETSF